MKTVLTLLFSLLILSASAQEKVTFRKKKKDSRTVAVPFYQSCSVRMKDGRRMHGFLQAQNDSVLQMRTRLSRKATWKNKDVKAIMADTSLSQDQRNQKLLEMMYPEKVSCAYDSIHSLRFSTVSQKAGVLRIVGGTLVFATGAYVFMDSVLGEEPNPLRVSPAIGLGALLVGGTVMYFAANKHIRTEKWELVRK